MRPQLFLQKNQAIHKEPLRLKNQAVLDLNLNQKALSQQIIKKKKASIWRFSPEGVPQYHNPSMRVLPKAIKSQKNALVILSSISSNPK